MRRKLTMGFLRMLFSPDIFYTLLFITAIYLILSRVTGISIAQDLKRTSKKILIKRLAKDEENTRRNLQLERIGRGASGARKRYRDLIQNVIISLKLTGLTVENFTSIFIFLGILMWIGYATFFDSVIIGALVAVPSIFAVIAMILSLTKTSVRANDNRVMDSLDLICPIIEHSVVSAIRKALPAFDPKIRVHYKNFLIDIDSRDMSLREAITELNRKLGPRFDEFARKTLLFHEAGEEGMSEIFMDIVEMNNFTRSINSKADIVYRDTNFNLLASSSIVLGFLVYAYNNPLTGTIMRETFIGKLASAVSVSIVIMSYAVSQIIQMSIDYDQIKTDK